MVFSSIANFYSVQPIHQVIDRDDEVKKIRTTITAGVEKAAKQLQAYTRNWDE